MGMRTWMQDLARVSRGIVRRPAHRIAIVFTLALGVAANAAILGAAGRLASAAPAISDPGSLVVLQLEYRQSGGDSKAVAAWSYPLWRAFVDGTRGRLETAAYTPNPIHVNLGGVEAAARARVEIVSGNYFALLGVPASAGRALQEADDRADAPDLAVASEALARREFGSTAAAVGRTVRLNDRVFTVVGVAGGGFTGLSERAELWVPMSSAPKLTFANRLKGKTSFWHRVVARTSESAQDGVLESGARAAAAQVALVEVFGAGELHVAASGWMELRRNPALARSLLLLQAAVAALLLLAILNATHLAVAAGIERRREQGVRLALGADRAAIVRAQMLESTLLGLATAGLGLLVGQLVASALIGLLQPEAAAHLAQGTPGLGSTVATCGMALAASLVVGLVAASRLSRLSPQAALAPVQSSGARLGYWRQGSIALQTGLAVLMLAGAMLAVRGAQRVLSAPLGFEPEGALAGAIQVPNSRNAEGEATRIFERAVGDARALPGVRFAGAVNCLPLSGGCDHVGMTVAGRPLAEGEPPLAVTMNMVSGQAFEALGIPLRQGRTVAETDRSNAPRVAWISEAAARQYWPAGDALGARIRLSVGWGDENDHAEVVGIVGDVPIERVGEAPAPVVYLSIWQFSYPENAVVLRTSGDAQALVAPLRGLTRGIDPDLPVFDLATLSERVASATRTERGLALVTGAFALLALLLAGAGVHGMVAFHVARRTREFGVRSALGASAGHVLGDLLRSSGMPALAGLAAGLLVAVTAGPLLARQLALPDGNDPLALLGIVALVALAFALALAAPARRALSVPPMAALRSE